MPRILADSVRRRALGALSIAEGTAGVEQLPALRRQLESGIRLFVSGGAQAVVLRELDGLCRELAPSAEAESVPIRVEADISFARGRARELARLVGAGEFAAQRAATAASELARNIVAYAGEGRMELTPAAGALTIVAEDRGPGIADIEAILEGRYRSRTGLGMGLRGVRRLARRFELESSPKGTRVVAEIAV